MGLLGKKVKKTTGNVVRENEYVNIMQILQSSEDAEKLYAKASDYKGRLLWQKFGGENGDDQENSELFEVHSAFISDPHPSAPKFVVNTLCVNLKNPKAATKMEE